MAAPFQRLLIYILLLTALLSGCTSPYTADLDRAENLMTESPDSALTILDSIPADRLTDSRSQALYALLLTQARAKNYITEINDSLISTAVSYFENADAPHRLMLSLYYLSEIRYNARDYAHSLMTLFRAHELALSLNEPFWTAMSARMIADIYHENYHTAEEIRYAEIELANFRLSGRQPHINYAMLDLAQTYVTAEKNTMAIDLCKQLIDSTIKYNDTHLKYETIRLIGLAYIHLENYHSAIPYLRKAAASEHYIKSDSVYLGYSYLKSGRIDSAMLLLKNLPLDQGELNSWLHYNIYLELDSTKKALFVLNDVALQNDSIVHSVMTQNLLGTTKEYFDMQAKLNQANLEASRLMNILILSLSTVIILLIVSYIFHYRRNQQAIIDRNVEIARNLREMIAQNDRKSQITIHSLLADRFDILDNLCRILYENPSATARKKVSDELNSIISQFSNDASKLEELESYINRHHDDILTRLKSDLPNMKNTDYRLVLYSLLGFSNSAIALFLGEEKITAIYDRRKRLKVKFKNLNSPYSADYISAISQVPINKPSN